MSFISRIVCSSLRIATVPCSGLHTTPTAHGWPRKMTYYKRFVERYPKRFSVQKQMLWYGEGSWHRTVWGKRLVAEMKDRNLMESDPWVQNQLKLKHGHKSKSKVLNSPFSR
eukprot:sb/3477105/